ncbi:integrase catalytic domain-containing protein [Trichonephila clavipes]|nr:integrase catalytic domain-containing protein [Trichonephila clavipes]
MMLHKWCSNKAPSTELQEFSLDRSSEEVMVKTLGMLWDSSGDYFTYKVTTSTDCNYTKRDVLSQIARIYDPLGLLGPVIAKAKIFMQQLWLLKLDWNETLPPDVSTQWRNFIQTLKDIESIHVPRCFLVVPTKFVVLNGFADASSKAYGAVIYVQTNETTNQLLCSKSR